jgi:S1-C subfamily serine protease
MALDARLVALQRRADRALGDHQVKDAVDKVRAIIGPQHIPNSEAAAQEARRLMRAGETPTPEQLEALSIVVRLLRPVVFVRNGQIEDLPDKDPPLYTQAQKDQWSSFRTRLAPLLFSVGRINAVRAINGNTHIGTGFLVAEGLLATNRHVLAALTSGSEALGPGVARVEFQLEERVANQPQHTVAIDGVAAVHPTLDMVLLRISPLGRPTVTVAAAPAGEETPVVVIGYPADDRTNNPLFLSGMFNGRFGVKRAALGEVLDGTGGPVLFHDCSTTQGNSGSPIFDLDSGHVVGLHRAGFFMYRNEAVDADALRAFIHTHSP